MFQAAAWGSQGDLYVPGVTEAHIAALAASGVNAISLSWEDTVDPVTGQFNTWNAATEFSDIEKIAQIAHSYGLTVSLEPYIQMASSGNASTPGASVDFQGYFGGDYGVLTTAQKSVVDGFAQKFLPNYENWLAKLGAAATHINASYMAIGGEMNPLDSSLYDASFWQPAIAVARNSFSGPLTYISWGILEYDRNDTAAAAANPSVWNSSASAPFHNMDLFKYLDLVGVQILDKLTPTNGVPTLSTLPSYQSILDGWTKNTIASGAPQNILDLYANYAASVGKPLLAIDAGFSSSMNPYGPPANTIDPDPSHLALYVLQAEETQAFLQNIADQPGKLWGYSFLTYYPGNQGSITASPVPFSNDWWWTFGVNTYGKPAYYTFLAASAGSNVITGDNNGDLLVTLFDKPSVINAGSGNDIIFSQDTYGSSVHGGAGTNKVIYNGNAANFSVTVSTAGTVSVTDIAGTARSVDTLDHIQSIQFSDRTLQIPAPLTTSNLTLVFDLHSSQDILVYEIYQAAFARMPDYAGYRFWSNYVDTTHASALTLADYILAAPEFAQKYGSNPTNLQYVTALYTNVLGRTPDQAGLDFWVNQANAGRPHDQLLIDFATSSENVTLIAPHTFNGLWTTS